MWEHVYTAPMYFNSQILAMIATSTRPACPAKLDRACHRVTYAYKCYYMVVYRYAVPPIAVWMLPISSYLDDKAMHWRVHIPLQLLVMVLDSPSMCITVQSTSWRGGQTVVLQPGWLWHHCGIPGVGHGQLSVWLVMDGALSRRPAITISLTVSFIATWPVIVIDSIQYNQVCVDESSPRSFSLIYSLVPGRPFYHTRQKGLGMRLY